MQHHLKYALENGTNRIVGIEDVANGLECGCSCPYCKQLLVAKNGGEYREHHFAHYNNRECEGARMSALHALAQQIIKEGKRVMLPDYLNTYYSKSIGQITFDEVELEKTSEVGGGVYRPDCIGYRSGENGQIHNLWIEIFVSHKVDRGKREAIKKSKVSCIEIDLSDMLKSDYSEESLKHRLFEEKLYRKWINCPKYDEINQQNKIMQEQEEADKLRKEMEARAIEEEAYRRKEEEELADKKEKNEMVQKWYKDGDLETATYFINEIKKKPFKKDIRFEDYMTKNNLSEILILNDDFLYYIDHTPKNEGGLQLFYTLLHYYYNQTTKVMYYEIKKQLRYFQYKHTLLSKEEKIHLEQLVSLYIIRCLEKKRLYNDDYKGIIKKYIGDSNIRNEVLMVASVCYHHIVGSSASNFGELTKEIIDFHPQIAKSYLAIINCQDKYPNNYYIDNHNMLDELKCFVEETKPEPSSTANDILMVCYSYAFPPPSYNFQEQYCMESSSDKEAWRELNEFYRNA